VCGIIDFIDGHAREKTDGGVTLRGQRTSAKQGRRGKRGKHPPKLGETGESAGAGQGGGKKWLHRFPG